MTTYYTETFPSASPAFGGDQSWTEITGNWVNAGSNTATVTLGSAVAYARCDNTSVPSADMAVTATVNAAPSGRSAGVAARMSNSGTLLSSQSFYAADFHFDTGTMYVLKCVSGTVSVLTSVAFTAPSFPCTITLSVYGTALEVDLNGSAIWSGSDSSITGGNRAGLDTYNSSGDVVFATPFTVASAVQALVAKTSTDSGTASETATVTLLASDSATATATASITATVTASDTAQMDASSGGYGAGLYGEGGYGGGIGSPVSIAVTPAAADTATGTETAGITTVLSSADTATAADVTALLASVAGSDAASAADLTALTATFTGSDTASLADGAALAISLTSIVDLATFGEAGPAISLTGPVDSATLADVGQVAASLTSVDAGSAADTGSIPVVGPTSTDTVTATDAAAITAALGDTDSSTAVDLATVTATATSSDSATASETTATVVVKSDSDTVTATDVLVSLTASVADVDVVAATGSGDGYGDVGYGGGSYGGDVPLISLAAVDGITAIDGAALAPSVSSSDTAVFVEATPTIGVAGVDAATAADSSALTYLLVSSDSATAADATVLSPTVFGMDSITGADSVVSLNATVAGGDGATAGETPVVAASLTASDSGAVAEVALVGLSDTDTASVAEGAPQVTLTSRDNHVAIDTLTALSAQVADVDTVSALMAGDGYGEAGYGVDPYGGVAVTIGVTAATPDQGGLAEAIGSLSANVTGLDQAAVGEQAPTIGMASTDAGSAADQTGLAVTAFGVDGVTGADTVGPMSATATASESSRAVDQAHIDAAVNGGVDTVVLDDSDALARIVTAILTGLDDSAGPGDAVGYGDVGYGGGSYGGTAGGAILTGTPSPATAPAGDDEPAVVLTGAPMI